MGNVEAKLGAVQETLLIPLYGRATLTRQGSTLIADPKAVEMVETIDYDFSRFDGTMSLIGSVLRTRIYDHWVRTWLGEHPTGTVVEIGAGLNTRYERLDNGRARWFELDLPDAMDLRRRFFADTDRRTLLAASVLDDGWLDAVAATGGPWFFAAEAVFVYLSEDEVRSVVRRLARGFPGSPLAFDTWSSWMRDHQDDHDTVGSMDARFTWFCDDLADLATPGTVVEPVETCTFADAPDDVLDLLPGLRDMLAASAGDPQLEAYRQNLVRLGVDPAGPVGSVGSAGAAESRPAAHDDPHGHIALVTMADLLTPMALRVAATLRLADRIAAGTTGRAALAAEVGADERALGALLAHLADKDVFTVSGDTVGLGPLGRLLRDGAHRQHLDLNGAPGRMDQAWFGLLDTVTTGDAGYPRMFGAGFWDDLAADPARAASFDEYMAAWASVWIPSAAEAGVWPDEGEIVDVGGGAGRLLRAVLERHPGRRGTVVELAATAARARTALADLGDRARVVEGSFFDPLPAGAATYVLAQVLHDWPDGPATAILRRCAEAAAGGGDGDGRIVVIERLADTGHAAMSLLMLNLFGARERTRDDYAALAGAAGLAVVDKASIGHGLVALTLAARPDGSA